MSLSYGGKSACRATACYRWVLSYGRATHISYHIISYLIVSYIVYRTIRTARRDRRLFLLGDPEPEPEPELEPWSYLVVIISPPIQKTRQHTRQAVRRHVGSTSTSSSSTSSSTSSSGQAPFRSCSTWQSCTVIPYASQQPVASSVRFPVHY